jgi:signal transduction histidine kinase/AmiR/NasT family two-component response regulator
VQGHPQVSVADALKRQSSLKANHRTKITFAALGAIAALTVVFSFLTYRELQSVADTRRDTFESIIGASNLLSDLKDAETGQRGFALTGDEAFLEPYVAVRDTVLGHLNALRSLTSSGTAQSHLDAIVSLTKTRLAELAESIEMRRRHDVTRTMALVASGQGKRTMDAIRAEMASVVRIERDALTQNEQVLKSKMRALFVIICAASVFTLLSLLLFAYVMYRESQDRIKALIHLETLRLLEVQSELNRQLQLANLAKSDFLSSMSHELRTPLNAILGFAQLLEMDSPSPPQERSIGQILKAGWHLLALINEILDLSLIESGKMSLSLESVSLADVMLECQSMIEPQAQKRGIRVAFPRFDTPIFVKADRMRAKQVLINLVSNAIKYNEVDGSVGVDCATVHDGRVRISVSDTGAGLTPDNLNHLFQPFNRLGQEGLAEEGTGVGLVVCKRLTELMGGAIGVESTVGEGCVFWIDLDVAEVPHADAIGGIPAVAVRPNARPDGKLHTLLYVEDNPANLMLVEKLIERRPDLRLLTARDGQRGVEIARVARPAVILMDINLPGISGIDALKMLADDPATAHIPVIALSASVMPRDIERGMEAGFVRYLTKPIKVPEFMDALDVALKIAQTHAAFTNVAQIAVA